MSKLNCIIVDDERLARLELRHLLAEHPDIHILDEAANAMEAIQMIDQLQPDLLFLDIQMPQWSGFDLLEKLDWTPSVIFTTAYDQYAVKAFEVNALDYLMKPINPTRLEATLEKIKSTLTLKEEFPTKVVQSHPKHIFIKDGDHCHFIQLKDISYGKAYDNYVRVYFNQTSAMIKKSMNLLEEKLDAQLFFRCNRAEMINLAHIKSVAALPKGKLSIELMSGELVEVSERKSVLFRERYFFGLLGS
jgi:two-component system, LytTR family, response regulator